MVVVPHQGIFFRRIHQSVGGAGVADIAQFQFDLDMFFVHSGLGP